MVFLQGIASIQGLLFASGLLYYQDNATIRSISYRAGDRVPAGASQVVTEMTAAVSQDTLHWPKVMDIAMDGKIYITNGASDMDPCLTSLPPKGGIFELQASGSLSLVSRGFRNPIAMRCEKTHNVCLVAELAKDLSAEEEGREKLVPVRPGDDWGFPCCATKGKPYTGTTYVDDPGKTPDCSGVAAEDASFLIGHTPFGLDFEPGKWPAPWRGRVFITLHGSFGTWLGARVTTIALDPDTGLLLPGSDLPGVDPGSLLDFATGWDNGMRNHGRPAPIAFAPDGRMFLGDDWAGVLVWIAPFDLMRD
jgi:glucose/arabinose dehydrogenase